MKEIIHYNSLICLQSPMCHNTRTCKNVAKRVDIMGMFVDETKNPIH